MLSSALSRPHLQAVLHTRCHFLIPNDTWQGRMLAWGGITSHAHIIPVLCPVGLCLEG